MSNFNNSRPTPSRNPGRRMIRNHQGNPCLWRLSGRYSSYRTSAHRGWIWTRPQHFPQPDETELSKSHLDNS